MAENTMFTKLLAIIKQQQTIINSIATKFEQAEFGGGGSGNASISDYVPGTIYKRNTLVVDPDTETVYRVLPETYTSVSVETDCSAGNLKLVGFESQIVTFDHNPTQAEITAIPDDSLVAVYSSADTPYIPDRQE